MSEELITTISGRMQVIEGEPRWLDLDVARWIGIQFPNEFRKRARRSESTLGKMGIVVKQTIIQDGAGAPGEEFWLNEKQCYFLIARSQQTPKAEEVTVAIMEAAYKYRHGKLAPRGPMSLEEREFFLKLTNTLGQLSGEQTETRKKVEVLTDKVDGLTDKVVSIEHILRGHRSDFPARIAQAIMHANYDIDHGLCSYAACKVKCVERMLSGKFTLTRSGSLDHVHQRNRRDFQNAMVSCKAHNQERENNAEFRRQTLIMAEAFHIKAAYYDPDRKTQQALPF